MKKLAMFLGCGVVAFAIGCGSESAPPTPPTPPTMDPKMMQEMQKGAGEVKPGDAAADPAVPADDAAAAEKKAADDAAAAEKKAADDEAAKKKE